MAHYLPKKKYLQLLHDTSPTGEPSSPSGEQSSPAAETQGSTTPTPSPFHNGDQLGIYFEPEDGFFQTEPSIDCSPVGESVEERQCEALTQYDHSQLATDILFETDAPTAFLRPEIACTSVDDRNKLDTTCVVAKSCSANLAQTARLFSCDEDGGMNLSCESSTLVDKSYCDDLKDGANREHDHGREDSGGEDVSSQELLDNAAADGLPSFSSLPDVDLLCSIQSSSGSFSSFLNGLESRGSPQISGDQVHDRRARASHSIKPEWISTIKGSPLPAMNSHLFSLPFDNVNNCVRNGVADKRKYRPRQSCSSSGGEPDEDVGNDSGMFRIKEELEDQDEYEEYGKRRPLMTTSGRNRGCGKSLEPKYVCQVCGDTAAGFHCGAYVCEACKVGIIALLLCSCL